MCSLKLLLALLALPLSPARDSESMLDFAPVAMDLQHRIPLSNCTLSACLADTKLCSVSCVAG